MCWMYYCSRLVLVHPILSHMTDILYNSFRSSHSLFQQATHLILGKEEFSNRLWLGNYKVELLGRLGEDCMKTISVSLKCLHIFRDFIGCFLAA